jgi:hypothetical protein
VKSPLAEAVKAFHPELRPALKPAWVTGSLPGVLSETLNVERSMLVVRAAS